MKRSTFLKSIVLAVTAPSILTYASPTEDIVKPDDLKPEFEPITKLNLSPEYGQNLKHDTLVMFVDKSLKVRVGDIIISDMGYGALVTAIMWNWKVGAQQMPGSENLMQLWCKPAQTYTYHYKDLNNIRVIDKLRRMAHYGRSE